MIHMTTVRKLLEEKELEKNFSVASTDTVLQALKVMAEAHIGAILVTEGGKIVGIYTERDYLYKGEIEGRLAKDTLVKDVMVSKMMTVTKDTTVEQCMGLMKQYNIRHLPVVEDEHLVGLVSMRDVMFAALRNKESEIRGLENYIMGSGFQS
ncbi:MAG: CBS domain-containing protein [Chloroflexi bacterium]|nr:CBS domain-containing protein [Chloroflexota bacterium]